MSDQSRCILRANEEKPLKGVRYFTLTFDISDSAPSTHPTLPYAVSDTPGSFPVILWGELRPDEKSLMDPTLVAVLKARFDRAAASVNGNGHHVAAAQNYP